MASPPRQRNGPPKRAAGICRSACGCQAAQNRAERHQTGVVAVGIGEHVGAALLDDRQLLAVGGHASTRRICNKALLSRLGLSGVKPSFLGALEGDEIQLNRRLSEACQNRMSLTSMMCLMIEQVVERRRQPL